jgi:hypothetical protein
LVILLFHPPPVTPSGRFAVFSLSEAGSAEIGEPLNVFVVPGVIDLAGIFVDDHERQLFFIDLAHVYL